MNKITVLGDGYANKWGENGWEACSTVTLIQTGKFNIICDPGTNTNILENGLKRNDLTYQDIDGVFLTHMHFDHCYRMALFGSASFWDYESVYSADKQELHNGTIFTTDIIIIKTPGHTLDHASLAVPVKDKIYVVAGDVFWWEGGEEQKTDKKSLLEKKDELAIDEQSLRKSREKILDIADFIIPGHGKMFENP